MARGGYRPGAGRPKGSKSKPKEPIPGVVSAPSKPRKARKQPEPSVPEQKIEPARPDEAPLDYMLRIMRDPEADPARRDRMAALAAPYVHSRAADAKPGKKEQRRQAAAEAGAGSSWGNDLTFNAARN